jgi:hypothetical protein
MWVHSASRPNEFLVLNTEKRAIPSCVSIWSLSQGGSRDSSVGIASGLWAGRPCFFSPLQGLGKFFSASPRPDRLWGPPSLLSSGYQGFLPPGYSGRGVKVFTLLLSSAEVKNAWGFTSVPQYLFMAWCLVEHRDNFTLRQAYEGVSEIFRTWSVTK